jgi:hypothetical protein
MPVLGVRRSTPALPSQKGMAVGEAERTLRDIRAILAGAGRGEASQAPEGAGPVPWEDVRRALTLCVGALGDGLAHACYWWVAEGYEGPASAAVRRMREARDAAAAVLKAVQGPG